MKIALVLGTNAGQADLLRLLNDKGWTTHACAHVRSGPGCDLAHFFHLVDIVDIEAVKGLAEKIEADIVYSVSSDLAITTATKVSEQLGLPTLLNGELIDLFNSKTAFREFLNVHDIGHVPYASVTESTIDSIDWQEFPCVVKPVDAQGQRGIKHVKAASEFRQAVQDAIRFSSNGEAIVEAFLDGAEFSTNVIVQGGEILLNEFSDRIVFSEDFFGLPKGHGLPISYIDDAQLSTAKDYVEKIVRTLKISDAVLYVQMRIQKGVPKVIEIAPRLDGCHIWRLIRFYRGIDLREWVLQCLLREKIDATSYQSESKHGRSELCFHHLPTNSPFSKDLLNLPEGVKYNEYRYNEGETITPINGRLEVVGYYIEEK